MTPSRIDGLEITIITKIEGRGVTFYPHDAKGTGIGSGSERRNESTENVKMKAAKFSPREPKTEVLKINKCPCNMDYYTGMVP